MSAENLAQFQLKTAIIAQFIQQVQQDPSLQQRLAAAPDQKAQLGLAVKLGHELGYEFTEQEVEEWLQSRSQELSEEELDVVAGGHHTSGRKGWPEPSGRKGWPEPSGRKGWPEPSGRKGAPDW